MKIRLPCKKCICFPICKSKYHSIVEGDLSLIYNPSSGIEVKHLNVKGYAKYRISERCSILEEYFYKKSLYVYIFIEKPFIIHGNFKAFHRVLIRKFKDWLFDSYYNKGIS